MNKRPFLILSLFLLLFSFGGQAADTYRPETSVAGFIPLPDCGRQVYNFNPGWRFFKGDIRGAEAVILPIVPGSRFYSSHSGADAR